MINNYHKGNPPDITIATYYWFVMDHFMDYFDDIGLFKTMYGPCRMCVK